MAEVLAWIRFFSSQRFKKVEYNTNSLKKKKIWMKAMPGEDKF